MHFRQASLRRASLAIPLERPLTAYTSPWSPTGVRRFGWHSNSRGAEPFPGR
jgi:hypothetical protein